MNAGGVLAVFAILLWSGPLLAAEPATLDGGGRRMQVKIGIGGGYPEIISLSAALGVPDRFEVELSGGGFVWFVPRGTVALRVGFPWVIVGKRSPGWWVSLVPKAGLRYMHEEMSRIPMGPTGAGGSSTFRGDEVDAVGIGAALSFEWGYVIRKRFGLILQLTGGATFLFAGQNEYVTYSTDTDLETTRTAEENSPWSPDLRASLVFLF